MMGEEYSVNYFEKSSASNPEDLGFYSNRLKDIDKLLFKLISKKRIQAAGYLISKDNKIVVNKSLGRLRYNEERGFMPDSIREIASITKLFTAVSILQLVEKGLIRLDQPVAEIIGEFKSAMLEKINIFHLLTHTSGIRPDPGVYFEPYPLDWDTLFQKDWLKGFLSDFSSIDPGKEWKYSSSGFVILGEIIKRVSGSSCEDYVMNNIVNPLGMRSTYYDIPLELKDRVCFANEMEEKSFYEIKVESKFDMPRGGGGLHSTLEDMQKFAQMLINKGTYNGVRILSRKTVEAMTRNQLKGIKNYCWGAGGIEIEYGLGMNVYSNDTFLSPGSFAHEGAGLSGLFMDPVENVVFAYMCPLCEGVEWEPEAVINLRNIVWSAII